MDIGLKIRSLRKEKKLSVEALALAVGASRQTIYDYESGRIKPSTDKIKLLAENLDVEYSVLKDFSVDKTKKVSDLQQEINNLSVELVSLKDEIIDLKNERKQFLAQMDRLTIMLESQLGKLFDCPQSTADSVFVSIWKNKESVEESVNLSPDLKRA